MQTLRIFISSPENVVEERERAKEGDPRFGEAVWRAGDTGAGAAGEDRLYSMKGSQSMNLRFHQPR
jgi:hypothetical protein